MRTVKTITGPSPPASACRPAVIGSSLCRIIVAKCPQLLYTNSRWRVFGGMVDSTQMRDLATIQSKHSSSAWARVNIIPASKFLQHDI